MLMQGVEGWLESHVFLNCRKKTQGLTFCGVGWGGVEWGGGGYSFKKCKYVCVGRGCKARNFQPLWV